MNRSIAMALLGTIALALLASAAVILLAADVTIAAKLPASAAIVYVFARILGWWVRTADGMLAEHYSPQTPSGANRMATP